MRAPPKRKTTAADDWLRAARRIVDGRADAVAYLDAAWESTSSWWLRPLAYAWAVSLGYAVRCWCILLGPQTQPVVGSGAAAGDPLEAARAPGALAALQKLELPFFATSATWVDRPYSGIRVQGNLREGALQRPCDTLARLRGALEMQFGHAVAVHLLEEDDGKRAPAPAAGDRRFELLVTDVRAAPDADEQALDRFVFLGSLAAAGACGAHLGSSATLQGAGSIVAQGSALPLGLLLMLLGVGELSRRATARSQGVALTDPLFLPSLQTGLVGVFAYPRTPSSSRASALLLALSAPLAVAAGSALLLVCSTFLGVSSGMEVLASPAIASTAWLLAALPASSDAMAWAGAQGLLIASLALLPHSPDGQAVLQSLRGRVAAQRVKEIGVYMYPLLGLLSASLFGPGWSVLPLFWTFLLFNFSQDTRVPPLEEASEVPQSLQLLGYTSIALALVLAFPGPVNLLWLH